MALLDFVLKTTRPLQRGSLKASLRRYLRQTRSRSIAIRVISLVITLIRVKSALARQRETLLRELAAWNLRPFSPYRTENYWQRYNEARSNELIYLKLSVSINFFYCRGTMRKICSAR